MRDCSLGLEGMDLCKGDMSRIELCCKRELRKLRTFAKNGLGDVRGTQRELQILRELRELRKFARSQRDPTRITRIRKTT